MKHYYFDGDGDGKLSPLPDLQAESETDLRHRGWSLLQSLAIRSFRVAVYRNQLGRRLAVVSNRLGSAAVQFAARDMGRLYRALDPPRPRVTR